MRRVVTLALFIIPGQVMAYQILERNGRPTRWSVVSMGSDGDIDYYQEVTDAPSGVPALVDSAFETWEALPSSTIAFTKQGQATMGLNRGFFFQDGVNVVSYGDAGNDLGTGVLAATVNWGSGTHAGPGGTFETIEESDIVFNDGVEFTDSEGASLSSGCIPQVTGRFDAEAVALHEIGHLIGLAHPSGETYNSAIMFPSISDCDPNRTNPFADDINGATFLYPSGTPAVYPGFTQSEDEGYPPLTVSFTNVTTGPATSYEWDFGDGDTSTAQNPTHEYTAVGSYTVRLTVNGTTSREENDAVRVVARPEPDFTADVVEGDPPLQVAFDNLTPNPAQMDWDWDFGDGERSSMENPVHTFQNEGFYTVTLWADAGPGYVSTTKTRYIKVGNPSEDEPLIPGCECRVANRRPSLASLALALVALAAALRRRK